MTKFLKYLALTTVMSAWISPQCQVAGSQEIPGPVIRVNTQLVLVDVVATDKRGQPLLDLRQEDFVLREDNKAQKIVFFTRPGEQKTQAPPPLPKGTYSNRPEYRSPGGPVTVVVLDAANTSFDDQVIGRRAMLSFLAKNFQTDGRMAVFSLTDKLTVLQDFTDDPQVLRAAVERYSAQTRPLTNLAAPDTPTTLLPVLRERPEVAAEISRFESLPSEFDRERRIAITLQALKSLARSIGGMPGRKDVLWLTGELPFTLVPAELAFAAIPITSPSRYAQFGNPRDCAKESNHRAGAETIEYESDIRNVEAQLATAQVAVYPIDVRGLIASRSPSTSNTFTMEEMAAQTGGRAFLNQNDLERAITLAQQDDVASYTIGYYPENKKFDHHYRRIKVQINRDGAKARHRNGYFAAERANQKSKDVVGQALQDKMPDTFVVFDAKISPVDRGKRRVEFLLDVRSVSAQDVNNGRNSI